MKNKNLLLKLISSLALLVLLAGCGGTSLQGGVINPPLAAAEINIPDHTGEVFKLTNYRGKVVLVFFGFTNCVEECPLTMAHIKLAVDALGADAGNVQVIMVSTDPVNDTPQAMQDFMGKFNPAFLGIPGSEADLQRIWKDYGVLVEDGGETHSSFTYVVDKAGNIRETFPPEATPEDITSDIQALLAEE